MKKTLIEELSELKSHYQVDSREADILRKAMFKIAEQERMLRDFQERQDEGLILARSGGKGLDRLFMEALSRTAADN